MREGETTRASAEARSGPAGLAGAVAASLCRSFERLAPFDDPYRHWIATEVFPPGLARRLRSLPFTPAVLDGVSGKRELHNEARHYFDAVNNARFADCAAVAQAFQSAAVTGAIAAATGAQLVGSFVRLEYAQDVDGFWLEPHTDLGVKVFTMLIYLSEGPDQDDLGTDIYRAPDAWARRTAFADNSALIFVPGADTWHGLARRPIAGVRRSVIMNYVTADWRAREQLAYLDRPVNIR